MRVFLDSGDGTTTTTARNSFPKFILQSSARKNAKNVQPPPTFGLIGHKARLANQKERFGDDDRHHRETEHNSTIRTMTPPVILDQHGNILSQSKSQDETKNEKEQQEIDDENVSKQQQPQQVSARYRVDSATKTLSAREASEIQKKRREQLEKTRQEKLDEAAKRREQQVKIERVLRKKFPSGRILKSQDKYDAMKRKLEDEENTANKHEDRGRLSSMSSRRSPSPAFSPRNDEGVWFSKLVKDPKSIQYENGSSTCRSVSHQQTPTNDESDNKSSSETNISHHHDERKIMLSEFKLLGGPKITAMKNSSSSSPPKSTPRPASAARPISAAASHLALSEERRKNKLMMFTGGTYQNTNADGSVLQREQGLSESSSSSPLPLAAFHSKDVQDIHETLIGNGEDYQDNNINYNQQQQYFMTVKSQTVAKSRPSSSGNNASIIPQPPQTARNINTNSSRNSSVRLRRSEADSASVYQNKMKYQQRRTRLQRSKLLLEEALRIGEETKYNGRHIWKNGILQENSFKSGNSFQKHHEDRNEQIFQERTEKMVCFDDCGGIQLSRPALCVSGGHMQTPGPRPSSARIARGTLQEMQKMILLREQQQRQEHDATNHNSRNWNDQQNNIARTSSSAMICNNDDDDESLLVHPVTRQPLLRPNYVGSVPGVFKAGLMSSGRNKRIAESCLSEVSQYHPLRFDEQLEEGRNRQNVVPVPTEFTYQ